MNAINSTTPYLSGRPLELRLRLIPSIEKYPRLVAFAQTFAGKLAVWGLFVAGLWYLLPTLQEWLPLSIGLLLIVLLPRWRWPLASICTVVVAAIQTRSPYFLVVMALGALLFWCARRWPQSHFAKWPITCLLLGCTSLILICCAIPRNSAAFLPAWNWIGLITTYLWFIGYALLDRSASDGKDLPREVATFRPFWGSTQTPFPKGAAYLRRVEAQNTEQLAVTQLKALKLLVWAILLQLLYGLWVFCIHTYLRVPWAADALRNTVQRTPYPWYLCWASQLLTFFAFLLQLSIFGHRVIACCRLAGFNALRNTWRPLSAPTVLEFFNRFYYYFKELLVDFFFYPAFFTFFKKHPRLRMVTATFAAAAFGNMYFHFVRDYWIIANVGLVNAAVNYQVYVFYCLALATALCISQLRTRKIRPGLLRGRVFPVVGVVFFYLVLDVFGSTERNYPLIEHFRFLGRMFGLNF